MALRKLPSKYSKTFFEILNYGILFVTVQSNSLNLDMVQVLSLERMGFLVSDVADPQWPHVLTYRPSDEAYKAFKKDPMNTEFSGYLVVGSVNNPIEIFCEYSKGGNTVWSLDSRKFDNIWLNRSNLIARCETLADARRIRILIDRIRDKAKADTEEVMAVYSEQIEAINAAFRSKVTALLAGQDDVEDLRERK